MNRTHPVPSRLAAAFAATLLVAAAAGATQYNVGVTSDDDTVNGNCTLREALRAASDNAAVDACPAGGASDLILLTAEAVYTFAGDELLAAAGEITVRGADPYYPESFVIRLQESGRFLRVQGVARLSLESLTIDLGDVEAGDGGVLDVADSHVELHDVHISASGGLNGGAIDFEALDGGTLLVERSSFTDCTANAGDGGAIRARLGTNGSLVVRDSEFTGNEARLSGSWAYGGALFIEAGGLDAEVVVERSTFVGNFVGAVGSGTGGAIELSLDGGATAKLRDLVLLDNAGSANGAIYVTLHQDASALLDRLELSINTGGPQLSLIAYEDTQAVIADSLAVSGSGGGFAFSGFHQSVIRATHLTAVDNSVGVAAWVADEATISLHNSIVWASKSADTDLDGGVVATTNLIGVDPEFVDEEEADYRLAAGSPAENAGNAALPGVQSRDLDRNPRTVGPKTDLGAFERAPGLIFFDDFEAGDAGEWSSTAG